MAPIKDPMNKGVKVIKETGPRENQATINEWAQQTFGTPTSAIIIFDRYMDEVVELEEKFQDPDSADVPLQEQIRLECADVLIVLYQLCEQSGFDLANAVDEKMEINRARKWRTDGDGVGQHID